MEESFNSLNSRSPSPIEQPSIHELPSSPLAVKFVSDTQTGILDSPTSSKSCSLSLDGTSTSLDSQTINQTDTSSMSSTVSQPEPIMASSPAKSQPDVSKSLSPEKSQHAMPSACTGLKLVIDNIDSTVKPRYQRMDSQNKSLNYVQVYAVKDRIDFSQLSNSPPSPGRSVYDILPTTADYQALKDNFSILVARILVEHIPYFKDFKGLVDNHISHPYSSEMAKSSKW